MDTATEVLPSNLTTILTTTANSAINIVATASATVDQSTPGTSDTLLNIVPTSKVVSSGAKMAEDLHFTMSAIVAPIICFIGMAGNILSIITWSRPGLKSSTGRYLIGQAVADFGVLLFFLLVDSVQYWSPHLKADISYGIFFSYIGFPFFFFTIVASIWITVGVTVDRYIMVCWIAVSKKLCTERRANFGLFIITSCCFIVNLPHFWSFVPVYPEDGTQTNDNKSSNNTEATDTKGDYSAFKKTDFGGGSGGDFYDFWIHCIILILIPWFSVLLMNINIIRKVSSSNKRTKDKKSSRASLKCKQSEIHITRLLLTVTFTFLVFIGLQCVVQCVWMQQPAGADMDMVSGSFAFAKTFILFNSTSNFILYCLTGNRFRTELMKMGGCIKRERRFSNLNEFPSSRKLSDSTTKSSGHGTLSTENSYSSRKLSDSSCKSSGHNTLSTELSSGSGNVCSDPSCSGSDTVHTTFTHDSKSTIGNGLMDLRRASNNANTRM